MKSLFSLMLVCALATIILVSGCATTAAQPLTPAQIASIACPQVNLAESQLTAFNASLAVEPLTASFATKANVDLAKIQPTVAAVCAAGATVTAVNLQALAQQALPALGAVVGSLPLAAPQQAQIQGALVVAETALGVAGVVEQQIQAAKAAAVPVQATSSAK